MFSVEKIAKLSRLVFLKVDVVENVAAIPVVCRVFWWHVEGLLLLIKRHESFGKIAMQSADIPG